MYEFIFEDLRYDFEQKIMEKGNQIKENCYNLHKKSLDGALPYAQCIKR